MDLLIAEFLGTPVWMWAAFMTVVLALLAFDLGVLHRDNHVIGVAESVALSVSACCSARGCGRNWAIKPALST